MAYRPLVIIIRFASSKTVPHESAHRVEWFNTQTSLYHGDYRTVLNGWYRFVYSPFSRTHCSHHEAHSVEGVFYIQRTCLQPVKNTGFCRHFGLSLHLFTLCHPRHDRTRNCHYLDCACQRVVHLDHAVYDDETRQRAPCHATKTQPIVLGSGHRQHCGTFHLIVVAGPLFVSILEFNSASNLLL